MEVENFTKKKYFIINIFYVSTKFVIVVEYKVISFNKLKFFILLSQIIVTPKI